MVEALAVPGVLLLDSDIVITGRRTLRLSDSLAIDTHTAQGHVHVFLDVLTGLRGPRKDLIRISSEFAVASSCW
jgi:hypothetical protein